MSAKLEAALSSLYFLNPITFTSNRWRNLTFARLARAGRGLILRNCSGCAARQIDRVSKAMPKLPMPIIGRHTQDRVRLAVGKAQVILE